MIPGRLLGGGNLGRELPSLRRAGARLTALLLLLGELQGVLGGDMGAQAGSVKELPAVFALLFAKAAFLPVGVLPA